MAAKKKEQKGMSWWGYAICFVIILVAIFMALDLVKTFTAKSSTVGFATETKYFEKAVDINFEIEQSQLQYNDSTAQYEYSTTIKAVKGFDGQKHHYELLVNNMPCSVNETGAGYLKSEYRLKYYNINGGVDVDDTLYITFQFFTNKTEIKISTKGNANAVSFWKSYISNDGLNLNVVYAKL